MSGRSDAKTIKEEFPTLSPKQIEYSDKLAQAVIDGKTGLYNAIVFINGISKLSEATRIELVGYIIYRVDQHAHDKKSEPYNFYGFKIPRKRLPKFKINTTVFTSKIAYLIYVVLAIVMLMYAKYKFDVLKQERLYELKRGYYRRY